MAKLKIADIVAKMKEGIKQVAPKKVETPVPKPSGGIRSRDMRQEAMDEGAHGAKEYFSEGQV